MSLSKCQAETASSSIKIAIKIEASIFIAIFIAIFIDVSIKIEGAETPIPISTDETPRAMSNAKKQ